MWKRRLCGTDGNSRVVSPGIRRAVSPGTRRVAGRALGIRLGVRGSTAGGAIHGTRRPASGRAAAAMVLQPEAHFLAGGGGWVGVAGAALAPACGGAVRPTAWPMGTWGQHATLTSLYAPSGDSLGIPSSPVSPQ